MSSSLNAGGKDDRRTGKVAEADIENVIGIIDGWAIDCESYCSGAGCPYPDHQHQVTVAPPGENGNAMGHFHDCEVSGSCEEDQSCELTLAVVEEFDQVEHMLMDLEPVALQQLIARSEMVSVHPARQALQVVGCRQEVVLSLPLAKFGGRSVAIE